MLPRGRVEARPALWEYPGMGVPTGAEFYARLQEALRDRGMPVTQTAIADMLGINQSAVAKWKSSESFPTFENAEQLANLTHVSFAWLLLGVGSKNKEEDVDEQTLTLLREWQRMPEKMRAEILAFVKFRASSEVPELPPKPVPDNHH